MKNKLIYTKDENRKHQSDFNDLELKMNQLQAQFKNSVKEKNPNFTAIK